MAREIRQAAYIGIDPGLTGCAALLTNGALELYDYANIRNAALNVNVWRVEYDIKGVALENPGTFIAPGRQISSKLINNLGQWEGILVAFLLPYELVHPATWQGKYKKMYPNRFHFKIINGKKKKVWEVAEQPGKIACKLYPAYEHKLILEKDEHRADAVLMAHYVRDKIKFAGEQTTIHKSTALGISTMNGKFKRP